MPNPTKKGRHGVSNSPTISSVASTTRRAPTPARTSAFAPGGTSIRRREDTPAPRATPAANQTQVEQKFGDAFSAARKSGVKTFTWQGKSYTTEVARPPANRAGNPPRPARNSREFSDRANRAASPRNKK